MQNQLNVFLDRCWSTLPLPFCGSMYQGWQWACVHTLCRHLHMQELPNRNHVSELPFKVEKELVPFMLSASNSCFLFVYLFCFACLFLFLRNILWVGRKETGSVCFCFWRNLFWVGRKEIGLAGKPKTNLIFYFGLREKMKSALRGHLSAVICTSHLHSNVSIILTHFSYYGASVSYPTSSWQGLVVMQLWEIK